MFRKKHTHLLMLEGRNVQVSACEILNGKVKVLHADGRSSMVDAKDLTEVLYEGELSDEIRALASK